MDGTPFGSACAPDGELLGLDLDPQALALARETLAPFGRRAHFAQASYTSLPRQLTQLGWEAVDGILLALVTWHARPRSVMPVVAASLLGGLALSNHQTAALIVPAAVIALWQERDALRARPVLLAFGAAAFVVGLAPYAYVPIASASEPVWSWGRISDIGSLWALITREVYGSGQLVSEAAVSGGSPATRVWLLLLSYWPAGLIALIGAAVAYERQR